MAISWTMTREQVADRALQKCGVLGAEQTPSSADRQLAIDTLDGILKSLPLYGLIWPKVKKTSSSLVVTAGSSTVAMPADWFGGGFLANVIDPATLQEKELSQADLTWYNALPDKTKQANLIEAVFVDPSKLLTVYPVPNQNNSINLWYDSVLDDSVAATPATPFGAEWLLGLSYGVAANIGDEFGVDPNSVQRFELKWLEARTRAMSAESAHLPVVLTVAD